MNAFAVIRFLHITQISGRRAALPANQSTVLLQMHCEATKSKTKAGAKGEKQVENGYCLSECRVIKDERKEG